MSELHPGYHVSTPNKLHLLTKQSIVARPAFLTTIVSFTGLCFQFNYKRTIGENKQKTRLNGLLKFRLCSSKPLTGEALRGNMHRTQSRVPGKWINLAVKNICLLSKQLYRLLDEDRVWLYFETNIWVVNLLNKYKATLEILNTGLVL